MILQTRLTAESGRWAGSRLGKLATAASWNGLLSLVFCILLTGWFVAAHAAPVAVPDLTSRVMDLTHTLKLGEIDTLLADIQGLESRSRAQLAVLVVPSTGEDGIEPYATRVFAQWQLGRKDADDGVLLLVALDDRRMRIEVGTGLEGAVTDIQAARILDQQLTPRFRKGDFAGGIGAAVQSLVALIESPSASSPTKAEPPAGFIDRVQRIFHRVVTAFSSPSSDAQITRTALVVALWALGVGAWHGSRARAPQGPRTLSHGTGKRGRRSRRIAERKAALWADLQAGAAVQPKRRWPLVLGLLAAGPLAATLALMNLAMPFILFMPVGLMYSIGYLSGRSRTARRIFGGIALAIAALVALGFYLGEDKVPWLVGGVFATPFVGLWLALVVAGIHLHWKRSQPGFFVRLALVCGVVGYVAIQLAPGLTPDERWIGVALAAFLVPVFGFFPGSGSSGGHTSDSREDRDSGWSSSSSGSSSSSSSSSSSGGGGSSSGGGASGSW